MNNIELIYKVLFLVFSVMWAGNILLFRTERQIIINPLLIIIAAILVVLTDIKEIFSINIENAKTNLYITYYMVVIWGLIITRRKIDLF